MRTPPQALLQTDDLFQAEELVPEPLRLADGSSRAIFAARRARQAQKSWRETPIRSRLAIVSRARRRLAGEAPRLARAVEVAGRSVAETLTSEVLPLLEACRFLERRAGKILRPRRPGGTPLWLAGNRVEIVREPYGVVLVLGAFNYPLFLAGTQALQALVAGNAAVVKPGRGGGAVLRRLHDALVGAGLDADLMPILDDSDSAGRVALGAGVDKVLLTGSAATGRTVLGRLAEELVPATMELSGCDAVFVRHDADVDLAARALRFGLELNAGATCIAPRRVYVHRSLAAPLEGRLKELLAEAPERPVSALAELRAGSAIVDALRLGARLLTGGRPEEGRMRPTVLAEVTPDAILLKSDIFAPILGLVPVDGDEDALELAAACPYALGAVVFGGEDASRDLASRLDAAVVVVNDLIVPTADPRVPFGGRGRSGFGTTRGAEGLLELTRPKSILVRRGRRRPHLDPPPADAETLFTDYIRATHSGGVVPRLAALFHMIRTAARMGRASSDKGSILGKGSTVDKDSMEVSS